MKNLSVWILTFNRPQALNRQINAFKDWADVHVFSNHPQIELTEENHALLQQGKLQILYNSLSDSEANSYCARSWNNIFLKAFKTEEAILCIQDDTYITNPVAFRTLLEEHIQKYDFIWGPAGDQCFYLTKSVLKTVGWFDERFFGCYCGDADWLKRIWQQYDRDKLSICDSHDWGFQHNDIGLWKQIPTDVQAKACDATYINQHEETEGKLHRHNTALIQSQSHFKAKWGTPGNGINGIGSMIQYVNPPLIPELDWYPWFTTNYLNGGK